MRRAELTQAVNDVLTALTTSKLLDVIEPLLSEEQDKASSAQPITELLTALKDYSIKAAQFDNNARKIIKIMGLSYLEDAAFWSKILSRLGRAKWIKVMFDSIRFAITHLPKLVNLVRQESLHFLRETRKAEDSAYRGKDLLSVILIEEENRFSSPARLIKALDGTATLYEACATMMQLPPEGLSVIACDSGSDKSFDFLGTAKIIECVTGLILSLWDRIVFFRERQLAQRIELIAESLPIIEQIGELEKESKLGPEQAEILRRKILDGVGKFIESGAIIPQIEERTHFNPRLLMAPEPKLLTASSIEPSCEQIDKEARAEKDSTDMAESEDKTLENLTDDERMELLRLLNKVGKKDTPELPSESEEPEL